MSMLRFTRPILMHQPRRLEFGTGAAGAVGRWAAEAGYRRILVVANAFNAGRIGVLGLAGEVTVFGNARPEPDTHNLDEALAVARETDPDLVIGFGGGSAMDLAKLVTVLRDCADLPGIIGLNRVTGRLNALAQVPTTAGTGSEAGIRALVTDAATLNKVAVESPHMLADFAVLDPELTLSVPADITAATGVDTLAHCVEAFTSRKAHPMIDDFARMGIRLVGRYLERAVRDGADLEARASLMLAAYYGGICLGPVNTAAGHAIAYPLGTRLGLAHGAANALVFPHVLAFNQPAAPEKTAEIVDSLGLGAATDEAAVRAKACAYCEVLGIEMHLSRLGATTNHLPQFAQEAHAIRRLMDNNPREMSEAEVLEIYRAAF
jgi:alcohol dehydrogenase class IV